MPWRIRSGPLERPSRQGNAWSINATIMNFTPIIRSSLRGCRKRQHVQSGLEEWADKRVRGVRTNSRHARIYHCSRFKSASEITRPTKLATTKCSTLFDPRAYESLVERQPRDDFVHCGMKSGEVHTIRNSLALMPGSFLDCLFRRLGGVHPDARLILRGCIQSFP